MSKMESLSFRKRYSKYLLIWAFAGSFFCLSGPIGFSTQLNQKARIESVIGFLQWVESSPVYSNAKNIQLKAHIETGSKALYTYALWLYNSTSAILFNHNQDQLSLFEPFRFFVIPKIIPPGIGS
ncbi:hypothetical protein OQX61_02775 [Pedobacter sp. PLR]|uniref:hypothetical protein n=1 Tax=Pedobacter sp. PLR TaxID=2994465 RepID=UPI0022470114|nr:hypothetical protein [Pedobacter sp. PLR]MCX2450185.1 hypothetical protein [Pedobacter sp. PLR]